MLETKTRLKIIRTQSVDDKIALIVDILYKFLMAIAFRFNL